MNRHGIIIADDHVLFRQGLKKIIEGDGNFCIIEEAGDGEELLLLLNTMAPQLIILDLSMPRMGGLQALNAIRMKAPDVKVLVLSMHKEYVRQALSAGANGYLLKDDADLELFSAIDNIIQGRMYLSPRITRELFTNPKRSSKTLSLREKEVLKMIGEGNPNRKIAEILRISVRTVERHRGHIMTKLTLNSTTDIVRYAIQHRYVTLPLTQESAC